MTVKKETIEYLINLDRIKVDEKQAHIVIDKEKCTQCADKPCLLVCPAVLYTLENGELHFDYAGCLECGTCRAVCKNGGITEWRYPRGSLGVNYRQG